MPDASVADAVLADLPAWDLTDLYSGLDAPELQDDFQAADAAAKAFAAKYEGKLASLSAQGVADAIGAYEDQSERFGRIMSFAGLKHAENQVDPQVSTFYQDAQERVVTISSHLLFFTLELNKIDDAVVEKWLATKAMAHYAPWLRNVRINRPHQLSDELERFLHEQHVVGSAAWNRLFDETMAGLRFTVDGEELTSAQALHLLTDASPARRKAAALALGEVFTQNLGLFARITNTLAKDKEIDDRWRKYPRPVSARNMANQVEDEVVDALVTAVRDSYPRLSHRYYALKAKWMGSDKLDYWDRNAPLPAADDRTIGWDEARETVLLAGSGCGGAEVLRQRLDRRADPPRQVARRLRPPLRPQRSPLSAAELPGQRAGYDDPGARARPRLPSGVGRRKAGPPGQPDAADAGRNRVGVWRDADLPPCAGC